MAACYLALDIGGSKYIAALIDRNGEIAARRGGAWHVTSADEILSLLISESHALIEETGIHPVACGVTIPGLADPERGLWVEASFSGIRDFAICKALEADLGIPVYCENDGQAYALAEMVFGCCQDIRDFLFINVSNGIGGAIVSGGRLLDGANHFAGEFGHCHLIDHGRPCKCGQVGCLEMHAAGPGIAMNYAELGGKANADGSPADCKCIASRARAGERIALETFELEGQYLGRVIAVAVNLLNPQCVVIGGGVSLAFDLFSASLRRTLREQTYANPGLRVLATPLGYDAGVYSAAAIAIIRMNQQE